MKGRMSTLYELLLVYWLAKVTNDSILQSAGPDILVRVGHRCANVCPAGADQCQSGSVGPGIGWARVRAIAGIALPGFGANRFRRGAQCSAVRNEAGSTTS